MKNVRKTVDKILNVCILVLFIAMFGVTTLNVIMRYIFNSPLSFAVEFGRYTFAGMVYLGSIYVMRDDGHIGLTRGGCSPEPLHHHREKVLPRAGSCLSGHILLHEHPHGY